MASAAALTSTARSPAHILQAAWKRIAPLELADTTWDNVGLMIEAPYPKSAARKILLTIDLTTAVCEEALAMKDCSLVVSYHPPIFSALKKITLANPIQASLLKLAASGISVFSPHTSLDAVHGGINEWLASPWFANTAFLTPLVPSKLPDHLAESHAGAGMGRMLRLKRGVTLKEVVRTTKEHLGLEHVQVATPQGEEREIKSIAICAGSGGSLFRGIEADCFLTGEMSHHEVLAMTAASRSVILTNHSNTERPFLRAVLREWLAREMEREDPEGGKWEVVVSERDADPLVVA